MLHEMGMCLTKSRDCIVPHGNIQSARGKKIDVLNKQDVSRPLLAHSGIRIFKDKENCVNTHSVNEKFDRTNT